MNNRTILIVDDAADVREVAKLSLEVAEGWKVLVADDGESGITMAIAEQPDAILLDVIMPDLDGPGTFALLQAEEATRDIPVIFLTAMVRERDRTRFMELGIQGMIAKPFDALGLAGEISRTLGWTE